MSGVESNVGQLLHDLVYLAAVLTTIINVLWWMANRKTKE